MCKLTNTTLGIKKLDFSERGKMSVSLTDGRKVVAPVSLFPDIKTLSLKKRNRWMILDDQFFTFDGVSKVYSVLDLLSANLGVSEAGDEARLAAQGV